MGFGQHQALPERLFPRLGPQRSVADVGIVRLLTGLIFALREARLADARGYTRRGMPLLLLSAPFLWLVLGWR